MACCCAIGIRLHSPAFLLLLVLARTTESMPGVWRVPFNRAAMRKHLAEKEARLASSTVEPRTTLIPNDKDTIFATTPSHTGPIAVNATIMEKPTYSSSLYSSSTIDAVAEEVDYMQPSNAVKTTTVVVAATAGKAVHTISNGEKDEVTMKISTSRPCDPANTILKLTESSNSAAKSESSASTFEDRNLEQLLDQELSRESADTVRRIRVSDSEKTLEMSPVMNILKAMRLKVIQVLASRRAMLKLVRGGASHRYSHAGRGLNPFPRI